MISRILTLGLCLLSSASFAYSERACHPNRIFIGPEYEYQRWNFPITDVPGQSENVWYGAGGYEYYAPTDIYFRLFGHWGAGKADTRWFDHVWSVEATVGYTFAFGCSDEWLVTPFTGLGYYQDRVGIYNEAINEFREYRDYIPLGILFGWDINHDWSIGLKGQANFIYHRSLKAGQETFNIAKKTHWFVELPITYRLCDGWDLSLVPEYTSVIDTNPTPTEWGQASFWGTRLEIGYSW